MVVYSVRIFIRRSIGLQIEAVTAAAYAANIPTSALVCADVLCCNSTHEHIRQDYLKSSNEMLFDLKTVFLSRVILHREELATESIRHSSVF